MKFPSPTTNIYYSLTLPSVPLFFLFTFWILQHSLDTNNTSSVLHFHNSILLSFSLLIISPFLFQQHDNQLLQKRVQLPNWILPFIPYSLWSNQSFSLPYEMHLPEVQLILGYLSTTKITSNHLFWKETAVSYFVKSRKQRTMPKN